MTSSGTENWFVFRTGSIKKKKNRS